jgi:hypothetical protein
MTISKRETPMLAALAKKNGEERFKKVNLNVKLLSPATEGWAKRQIRDWDIRCIT